MILPVNSIEKMVDMLPKEPSKTIDAPESINSKEVFQNILDKAIEELKKNEQD